MKVLFSVLACMTMQHLSVCVQSFTRGFFSPGKGPDPEQTQAHLSGMCLMAGR